jgi:nucleotide-binding universal stress UspA family protein
MFKHILIPNDGSETAAKAIQAGVQLAKEMGAKVTGCHAQGPAPTYIHGEGSIASEEVRRELDLRARKYAENCVGEIANVARAAGVDFQPAVVKSRNPYEGIIEAATAAGCDAIVMASHGHRGVARLLLGSVTQEVLTHSAIPVLVLR